MADAMERIEGLESIVKTHVEKFDAHVEKQQAFNEKIVARVVDSEKADISIAGKLDMILERMNNKRIGWQIWLPFSATAVISLIALAIQVWPKGVAP